MTWDKDCVIYPHILPQETVDEIYDYVRTANMWCFDLYSEGPDSEAPNPILKVVQEYEENSVVYSDEKLSRICDFLDDSASQLLEDFCGERIVKRRFCSFQVSYEGHHGRPHIDSAALNYKTCMFFLSPTWDQEWAGDFLLKTRTGEWSTIPYTPRSAVCFNSNLLHTGIGANVKAKKLRLTYVCQGHTSKND